MNERHVLIKISFSNLEAFIHSIRNKRANSGNSTEKKSEERPTSASAPKNSDFSSGNSIL